MRRCFPLLICLIALATSSCSDKTTEEIADVIVLSRSSVAFAMEGGTTTVSVASPSEWTAACPDSWVTLTPKNGLLTIDVDGNTTDNVRDSKITVSTVSDTREIVVHQGYSQETVILSTTVSNEISFDSEGESFLFSVMTNGQWDASCDADWLIATSDQATGTVRLEAKPNTDSHRTATVTINSKRGALSESCKVAVSQISRSENPYYNMLGYYGLYAENWYYGGNPIGVSGTGTFCSVEQKEYRKSFYIKNLFLEGTVVEATYDKNDCTMSIDLGKLCYTREISSSLTRYHYVMACNLQTRSMTSGILYGKLGEGYNDDADQMRKAILLGALPDGYPSLGLIGLQIENGQTQYMTFGDLYYATGSMYLVEWDTPAVDTDVTRISASTTPSAEYFPVYPEPNN